MYNFNKIVINMNIDSNTIKKHVINYCEKVYERPVKNLFWYITNFGKVLDTFKAGDFNATTLSTYDYSTLYTTLSHICISSFLLDMGKQYIPRSDAAECSD